MAQNKTFFISLALLLLIGTPVWAAESKQGVDQVLKSLSRLIPNVQAKDIAPSKIPGVYEVILGQQIAYVSGDGKYLIQGDMIDLDTRENITEPRLNGIKAKAIASVGEENMISFGADNAKHTLTVFTDIDCGYCRKLHQEMDKYNANEIRIRYLFYPRAGIPSESYDKAVSVWCADDRHQAMTDSKAGRDVPQKQCDNPVKEHYLLGQEMGLRGTPALVLESGKVIPGYVPADRLRNILEELAAQ